ncbi:MAG: hypothetical protein HWD59_02945 [Coxiellaceae bacterium]|nr:MAG: hypothetical protein HWD59_02945 [Coxiellaceae bacterium]
MPNESYYAFVLRCKPFLLAVKNLSATKENKVLALMYEVAEQGLEKLFGYYSAMSPAY